MRRTDPVVRERIGRANLTKADLQKLADAQISGEYGGQRHRDLAQRLNQAAADRVPANGRTNRFSRWRATRRGTKALKAAYAQAAKDVKKMDPAVRESIGKHRITRSDLQALSEGQMAKVFRPEGRMGATPGAQQPQPQPQSQQPQSAQLDALAEQLLRMAELQLQATMLQNQRLQEIQQQLAQTLQQAQQQTTQPQTQTPGQQPAIQPDSQNVGQHAAVQPDSQTVGQHAAVQPDPQAPAQPQHVQPQPQDPAQAQPQTDPTQAWVASGTGNGTRQPAALQVGPEQHAPAAQLPSAQREAPSWQAATNAEAAAANQQWTPDPQQAGPDMSAQNQADMKGEMSKLHHVAFTGTAQPRIQTGDQSRPAGARPPGTEPHRSTAPGADRTTNPHER